MTELVLDADRSKIRLHTFAEGLLARLAHDLELQCAELSGTAVRDESGGGTASIEAPLRGIFVAGVLGKDGRLDEAALSLTEKRDCVAKMCHDVFHSRPDGTVRVEIKLAKDSAQVSIVPPNGKRFETTVRPDVRAVSDSTHGMRASGKLEVSLSAIGSDVVKGPMNAFRVKDKVLVSFDVVFAPPAQPA